MVLLEVVFSTPVLRMFLLFCLEWNEISVSYNKKSFYATLFTKIFFNALLQLARETLSFWVKAFSEDTAKRLENFGFIQFRPGGMC